MTEAARRRIVRVNPVLAVGSKFAKYAPETERDVRVPEITVDRALARLRKVWDRYVRACSLDPNKPGSLLSETWDDEKDRHPYRLAMILLEDVKYPARAVEQFSILIPEFQGPECFSRMAGYFLTALVNNGRNFDYVLHTKHYGFAVSEIGTQNSKRIIVDGDVGNLAGTDMRSGRLLINGNADDSLGCAMKGGIIIINGNATEGVGSEMEGGTIIVKGNADRGVGFRMMGGEIHLEGDYKSLDEDIKGGKIYHKGKLIVDK